MIKNNKSGKKAPNFILPNQYDEIINLSKIKNKFIVLFFYPKDDTPGCTIESIDFSKLNKNFIKLNAKVYGISKDDQKSHCKFIDKYNLKVDLLSDNKLKTIKAYKVWGDKMFMGKKFKGVIRSTFVIDKNKRILKTWKSVKVKEHAKEVLDYLKSIY